MTDEALVLVDFQKGFEDAAWWGARNNPDAELNAAGLLSCWRRLGAPIIHVQHASTEPRSPLRPDQPGHAFMDFCQPLTDEPVYVKSVNSAFIGTALESDLRKRGLVRLLFCGATTDHCVNTSVRMAENLGFTVRLAEDACFTFDKAGGDGKTISARTVHEVHCASLSGEFAELVDSGSVITAHGVGGSASQ